MTDTRRLNEHASLVNRMAETLGLDLTDALERRIMSRTEWGEAVHRCAGCGSVGDCKSWLAAQSAPEDRHGAAAGHAPAYCENRQMMGQMKRTLAEDDTASRQTSLQAAE